MSVSVRWMSVLGVSLLGLLGSGCGPGAPAVTVTIKPVAGAAENADTGSGATSAEAGYGTLVGTVKFDGSVPSLAAIIKRGDKTVKDADVCAAEEIPDESLIIDSATLGIANVIIFLDKKPANIKPELKETPKTPILFDQKGCRFLPHILVTRVGQPLKVLSDDTIAHNTHTFPTRNTIVNTLVNPKDRVGVDCTYQLPETNPVEVKCDLHPWMKAYHFPVDHPYVAVTDAQGKFKIEGVPAGKQSFKVWHERGGLLERKLELTITADGEVQKDLTFGAARLNAGRVEPGQKSIDIAQFVGSGTTSRSAASARSGK